MTTPFSLLTVAGTVLPACGSRVTDAAADDCTTEALNTHKIGTRRLLYPWHPLFCKELSVSGQRTRRGVVMVVCRDDEGPDGAVLEIPTWMFDAAECCRFESASSARVDVSALRALRELLKSAPSPGRDMVKAQHQSNPFGGFDAKVEDSSVPVSSVPGSIPKSATAAGDQPQASSSSRPSSAPTRGLRSDGTAGFGGGS
jgi:hypothetical protein